MKITEIVNGVQCYVATVRIKRGKTTTTAKTIICAESTTHARTLLSAMYGDDSVVSVSKVSESDLNEAVPNGTAPTQVPKPISRILPTAYTQKLAQNALFNQIKQGALRVKPTVDDLHAAQDEFDAQQKRANREYEQATQDKQKWDFIRQRKH